MKPNHAWHNFAEILGRGCKGYTEKASDINIFGRGTWKAIFGEDGEGPC